MAGRLHSSASPAGCRWLLSREGSGGSADHCSALLIAVAHAQRRTVWFGEGGGGCCNTRQQAGVGQNNLRGFATLRVQVSSMLCFHAVNRRHPPARFAPTCAVCTPPKSRSPAYSASMQSTARVSASARSESACVGGGTSSAHARCPIVVCANTATCRERRLGRAGKAMEGGSKCGTGGGGSRRAGWGTHGERGRETGGRAAAPGCTATSSLAWRGWPWKRAQARPRPLHLAPTLAMRRPCHCFASWLPPLLRGGGGWRRRAAAAMWERCRRCPAARVTAGAQSTV